MLSGCAVMISTLKRRGFSKILLSSPCAALSPSSWASGGSARRWRGGLQPLAPSKGACGAVTCQVKHSCGWDGVRNLVNPLSVHIYGWECGSPHWEPSQSESAHPSLDASNLLATVCHYQKGARWGFWAQQSLRLPSYILPNKSSVFLLQHIKCF